LYAGRICAQPPPCPRRQPSEGKQTRNFSNRIRNWIRRPEPFDACIQTRIRPCARRLSPGVRSDSALNPFKTEVKMLRTMKVRAAQQFVGLDEEQSCD
jgi:hypothetical protein